MLRNILQDMNRFIIFILIFTISPCVMAQQGGLQQSADALATDPVFSHAGVGICVMNGLGETLAEVNEDKMLVPASNMKLISTGAALFSLGPDFRFSTDIAQEVLAKRYASAQTNLSALVELHTHISSCALSLPSNYIVQLQL